MTRDPPDQPSANFDASSDLTKGRLFSKFRLTPALVLGVAAVLLATQIGPWWHPTPDAVAYLSIAANFADGRIERLGEEQLYFAPGYPLLISPAFLIADRPFLLISLAHWALALLVLLGVYRWAASMIPRPAAAVIAALVVLNATFWLHLRPTLSETAFMAAWIWTVLAMRALLEAQSPREALTAGFFALVLLAITSLTRHAGIFLGMALVLRLMMEARRRRLTSTRAALGAAVCLPAFALLAATIAFDRSTAGAEGTTYLAQLLHSHHPLLGQLNQGLRQQVSSIGQLLIPFMHKDPSSGWLDANMLLYLPLFAAVVAGWWRLVRRTGDLFALAAPFYFALYLLWPYDQGARFMQPLLPLLYLCIWELIDHWDRRRLQILLVLLALHTAVAVGEAVGEVRTARANAQLWPQIDSSAVLVGAERENVASVAVRPSAQLMMFQLALDRRTTAHEALADVPSHVRWVLAGRDVPVSSGFEVRADVGESKLLERTAHP